MSILKSKRSKEIVEQVSMPIEAPSKVEPILNQKEKKQSKKKP